MELGGTEETKRTVALDARAGTPKRPEVAVVPRWVQLVVLPLLLLGGWALVRAAGPLVLLFTVAALVALLLNRSVEFLHKARVPRGLAVPLVFLGLIVTLAGIGVLIANPVADQAAKFRTAIPGVVDEATHQLTGVQDWLDRNNFNLEVQRQGQTALQTLGDRLTKGSGELVSFTRDVLGVFVEASFAVVLVIVLSVYMLLYGERIGRFIRSLIPGGANPEENFPARIQSAVFGYVRGQLLFSLIMGTSAGLMVYLLGVLGIFPQGRTYAVFFGVFFGLAELIPYIGPIIGALPPILIALFSASPLDAVWLTIAFVILQQIEGHVVAPNVFGQVLRINPLIVILVLLLGAQLYGIIGALVALPVAAVVRETYVYFKGHLVLEPWGTPSAGQLVGLGELNPSSSGTDIVVGADACPECRTPRVPELRYCRRCGRQFEQEADRRIQDSDAEVDNNDRNQDNATAASSTEAQEVGR